MYYVGLDIHKNFCQATIMDANGKIEIDKKIPNKPEILEKFLEPYSINEIAIEVAYLSQFMKL